VYKKKYKLNYKHKKKYNRIKSNPQEYTMYQNKYKNYRAMSGSQLRSWDIIHKKAANAVTDDLKREFGQYIEYLSHSFPCPKCRPHIKSYLGSHPLKNHYEIIENGRDIGMAKWSWEFHNDVNKRLGKSIFSWENFKQKY